MTGKQDIKHFWAGCLDLNAASPRGFLNLQLAGVAARLKSCPFKTPVTDTEMESYDYWSVEVYGIPPMNQNTIQGWGIRPF
jgi:hypothetical protein